MFRCSKTRHLYPHSVTHSQCTVCVRACLFACLSVCVRVTYKCVYSYTAMAMYSCMAAFVMYSMICISQPLSLSSLKNIRSIAVVSTARKPIQILCVSFYAFDWIVGTIHIIWQVRHSKEGLLNGQSVELKWNEYFFIDIQWNGFGANSNVFKSFEPIRFILELFCRYLNLLHMYKCDDRYKVFWFKTVWQLYFTSYYA